jgi:hypothetical protein
MRARNLNPHRLRFAMADDDYATGSSKEEGVGGSNSHTDRTDQRFDHHRALPEQSQPVRLPSKSNRPTTLLSDRSVWSIPISSPGRDAQPNCRGFLITEFGNCSVIFLFEPTPLRPLSVTKTLIEATPPTFNKVFEFNQISFSNLNLQGARPRLSSQGLRVAEKLSDGRQQPNLLHAIDSAKTVYSD